MKYTKYLKVFACLSILLFLAANVNAGTVVLTPEKDCYLYGWYSVYNDYWDSLTQYNTTILKVGGGCCYMYAGSEMRTLIFFNLSSIPANANIASAELKLYYSKENSSSDQGRKYYACRLTEDWDESTLNSEWKQDRDRPNNVCSGSVSTVPASTGWMTWDVTEDVRGFLNGNYTNYGWVIKDGGGFWHNSQFDSREAANKPQLVITYTTQQAIPEFTPISLLAALGLLVLLVRKVSG